MFELKFNMCFLLEKSFEKYKNASNVVIHVSPLVLYIFRYLFLSTGKIMLNIIYILFQLTITLVFCYTRKFKVVILDFK